MGLGATLVIAVQGGETTTIALPSVGWSIDSKGTTYTFKNAKAPAGISQARAALVKAGKALKVMLKTSGITLDEPTQGTVTVALVIGSDVYCSTCTTPLRDEPGRYIARQCAPPTSCPATAEPTPTPMATPGVCGDNTVNQTSEECDGTDPGVCDDLPVPLPFEIVCDVPSSPTPCECCSRSGCLIQLGGSSRCCGGGQCQDTVGVGMVRAGACIPPSCADTSQCNGYDCVGGTCCGQAGEFCGVVGCCPGSETTCNPIPNVGGTYVCCRAGGATCAQPAECCSGSCTAGACD